MAATPKVNLLSRDFSSVRNDLQKMLQARYGAYWKDFVSSGVGPAIVDVIAWVHENNTFYYDRLVQNSFLPTVTEAYAARQLAAQLGYPVRGRTASSVPVTLRPSPVQSTNIIIPKGASLSANGKTFEFTQDFVIPASRSIYPDVGDTAVPTVAEGSTQSEQFTSDGSNFQSFTLSATNIIPDSIEILVDGVLWGKVRSLLLSEDRGAGRDVFTGTGASAQTTALTKLHVLADKDHPNAPVVQVDGQVWVQVDSFTGGPREYQVTVSPDGVSALVFGSASDGSAPTLGSVIDVIYLVSGPQQRYEITYQQNGVPVVRFGDGLSGVVPPANALIQATYRVGGGLGGNVASGVINTTVSGILPNGAATLVGVTNLEPGTGGQNEESVASIRANAAQYAAANERAVTANDWTTLASSYSDPNYGSVSFAKARLKAASPERNTVSVAVWGRDSAGSVIGATSSLRVALQAFLNSARTLTTVVEVEDGVVVFLDLSVDVTIRSGYDTAQVLSVVQATISNFFTTMFPGEDVALSRLYDQLQEVSGVDFLVVSVEQGLTKKTTTAGTGDGAATVFSGTIAVAEGSRISPGRFTVGDGTLVVYDNGSGVLIGDVGVGTNTLNYETGEFTVTFNAPPTNTLPVTADAYVTHFVELYKTLPAFAGGTSLSVVTDQHPIRKRRFHGVSAYSTGACLDGYRLFSGGGYDGVISKYVNNLTVKLTLIEDTVGTPDVRVVPIYLGSDGVTLYVDSSLAPSYYASDFMVGEYSASTGRIYLYEGQPSGVGSATYLYNVRERYQTVDSNTNPYIIGYPTYAEWTSSYVDVDIRESAQGRHYFLAGFEQDSSLSTLSPESAYYGEASAYDDGNGVASGDANPALTAVVDYEEKRANFFWSPALSDQGGFASDVQYLYMSPSGGSFDGLQRTVPFAILTTPYLPIAITGFTYSLQPGDIVTQQLFDASATYLGASSTYGYTYDLAPNNTNLFGNIVNATTSSHIKIWRGGSVIHTISGDSAVTYTTYTVQNSPSLSLYDRYATGRMRFPLYRLSQQGYTLYEAYDNGSGNLDGRSLDPNGQNYIQYATGKGEITFLTAPPVAVPTVVPVLLTSVFLHLIAGLSWAIKSPVISGNVASLFADDTGRLWGTAVQAYPNSRLDHDVGKLTATFLSGVSAGQQPILRYESGVTTSRGVVPIADDSVAALGRVTAVEA